MKKYDLAVVIGRFQPVHNGHISLFNKAMSLADKVLILIGSANQAPTPKNPFTHTERHQMITQAFASTQNNNVVIDYLTDNHYSDSAWMKQVQHHIDLTVESDFIPGSFGGRVCIVGHKKDDSSRYLDWFPNYTFENHDNVDQINATDIRNAIYDRQILDGASLSKVPRPVATILEDKLQHLLEMGKERDFIKRYQSPYESLPYKPIFVTVDAVVVWNKRVLLIKRKARPGKGLWAMPGGFLNADERIKHAITRELTEETGLRVTEDMLQAVRVFDAPQRSARGRTITHCGLFYITSPTMPKVKGSDDAAKAKWVPILEFNNMQSQMFEDHWHVISSMLVL